MCSKVGPRTGGVGNNNNQCNQQNGCGNNEGNQEPQQVSTTINGRIQPREWASVKCNNQEWTNEWQ